MTWTDYRPLIPLLTFIVVGNLSDFLFKGSGLDFLGHVFTLAAAGFCAVAMHQIARDSEGRKRRMYRIASYAWAGMTITFIALYVLKIFI